MGIGNWVKNSTKGESNMWTKLRGNFRLLFMMCAMLLAIPAVALASDANVTSVVDVTTPNGAVTLQAGQSENITINMTVTGNQVGDSTFEVNRDWQLQSNGTFVGSNPKEFSVGPQSGGTTTPFSTTGTVSVASGVAAGGPHALKVGVFDITNTNTTGAKLVAGSSATYSVTVASPPPPSDTTAPTVTAIASKDANPTNAASVRWDVTFSENVTGVGTSDFSLANTGLTSPSISGVTGSGANYVVTADTGSGNGTLGLNLVDDDTIVDGANNKLGGTGTGTGNLTGEVYTIDKTKPEITASATTQPGGAAYTAGTWTNKDVAVSFSCLDSGGSDIDQNTVAGDTLTTSGADQSVTNTGTCTDKAGNVANSATFSNIDIDKVAPTVTLGAATGTSGTNGWYTSVVTQTFNASDALSGLAGPASFTKSSGATEEGSNVNIASGVVYDNAGNTASTSAGPFKIDLTDPVANCDSAPSGWSGSDVSINCQASDAVSGLANAADANFSLATSVPTGTETANASTGTRVVTDAAGRSVTAGPINDIKVDKKAPALVSDGPTTQPNAAGWYKTAVTNGFTATDGGSGFAPSGNLTYSFSKSSGTNEGAAVTIASGAVSDAVGNSTASINSAAFKIDLSDPTNVTFQGGPAANTSYDFGSVPAAPTCIANDAPSGLKSCVVTGYSTAVGTHTMTATATDNADRTATVTRIYTVNPYTLSGFYSPVDYNGTWNTVKGGSTVPLKFEVFNSLGELTNTSVVKQFIVKGVACPGSNVVADDIEMLSTGGTALRYDGTGGQFIQNWQTPKKPGTCYDVTVVTIDGTQLPFAHFMLK